jgi:hypothetical protein
MVLTVSFVLFPATNSFLSPSPTDLRFSETRFGSQNLCRLDISNGCQNHTTSPYALAPFVCTRVHRAPNAAASTASHPAFVTTRDPPLVSGVRRRKLIEVICPTRKAEYFCEVGLDEANRIEIAAIIRREKIVFRPLHSRVVRCFGANAPRTALICRMLARPLFFLAPVGRQPCE